MKPGSFVNIETLHSQTCLLTVDWQWSVYLFECVHDFENLVLLTIEIIMSLSFLWTSGVQLLLIPWKWRSMYKNPGSSQWWTSASTPCSQVDIWPSGRGHSSYSQLWTCKEYEAQTLNCFSSFNLKIPFKCMRLISVVYHLCYMKDKTLQAHTTCFTSSCFNNEIKFSSRLKWLIQHYPSILKQF